jgi:hypothetical protein
MRHPCERGRQRDLKQVVFFAVREALNAPAHPDSKRQERRKRRDLERYGSRAFKTAEVSYTPMLEKEEELIRAKFVASRLGVEKLVWTKIQAVPVDAYALLAHIGQAAEIATGAGAIYV